MCRTWPTSSSPVTFASATAAGSVAATRARALVGLVIGLIGGRGRLRRGARRHGRKLPQPAGFALADPFERPLLVLDLVGGQIVLLIASTAPIGHEITVPHVCCGRVSVRASRKPIADK